jgi:hypothetical protein
VGGVTKLRFALIFLATLTLGLSLGLPAEDVLDAIYDESETLPFEANPPVPSTEEQLRFAEPQAGMKSFSACSRHFVPACRECQSQQTNLPDLSPNNSSINNSPIIPSDSAPLRC